VNTILDIAPYEEDKICKRWVMAACSVVLDQTSKSKSAPSNHQGQARRKVFQSLAVNLSEFQCRRPPHAVVPITQVDGFNNESNPLAAISSKMCEWAVANL
jgi:hypothetical protein